MKDDRIKSLKNLSVSKAIMKMAIPSIIGLLVVAIYNIVDTMFVAWLGTEATGATQIVFPIVMGLSAIGLTFGIGGGSYISRLLGESEKNKASKVASTSFFVALAIGIATTIFGIMFIEQILTLFGATSTIMPLAKEYGIYIMLGASAQIVNMTLNNLLRSEGSAKQSMIGMLIGAVLNIALDPIFIFVFGLGVKGAAIATTISQFVTMFILLSQYIRAKSILSIALSKVSFDISIIGEILKVGSPSFVRQILMSISLGLLNQAAGTFGGDTSIAAIGIVTRTMMISIYIIFGLSQGFQPVAGYNYGAKEYKRLSDSLKFTSMLNLGISVSSSALFLVFGKEILSIYKPSAEVLAISLEYIRYFAFSMILMSFTNVIGVYYQAVGKGLPALILSTARQGIFLIPLLLILPNMFGMYGVYLSQPISDVLTLILSVVMFIPTKKEVDKLIISSV